jgi:hypothetical protein
MSNTNPNNGDNNQTPGNNDIAASFQNLVARQGTSDAAGLLLFDENRQYREKIRKLEADLEKAAKKIPGKDVVVLSAEDAKLWQAYKDFGSVEDIKNIRNEVAGFKREKSVNAAARAASYSAAVLLDILPSSAVLSVKSATDAEGNQVQAAYIKVGEGNETPLTDYANQNWKHFLPALVEKDAGAQGKASGTTYIQQKPGGKPPKGKELSDEDRKARVKKRSNFYTSI